MRSIWILPFIVGVSLAAAEARLTPEQRIAPFASQQEHVQVVRASGHVVAVWTSGSKVLDVSFDGNVLGSARVDSKILMPAVAAGSTTFLVAWTETDSIFASIRARRLSRDGVNLDIVPLELCAGRLSRPSALLFDGNSYVVGCADARVLRVTESGSVSDDVRPRTTLEDMRPLRAGDRLLFAGASYYVVGIPVLVPRANVYVYGINDLVGYEQRFSAPGSSWAAAAGPDRIVVAMFPDSSSGRVTLAQSSFDRGTLRTPYRPSQFGDAGGGNGGIVWNGSEYVVAWVDRFGVRALRLDRFGDPIDAEPITISSSAIPDTPSLSVTDNGVVIAYSRKEGLEVHAYMRTLERLAPPVRRQSVRH
jgi:hypothetical protein